MKSPFENERSPIRFGVPKNSQLRKDSFPVLDALQMRPDSKGNLKSDLLPELVGRELRVQDIVQLMRRGALQLGIVSDDVNAEYGQLSPSAVSQAQIDRVLGLNIGKPVTLSWLVREEDVEAFERNTLPEGTPSDDVSMVISSYPNVVQAELQKPENALVGLQRSTSLEVLRVFGQTESMLRNGDVPSAIAAVDVVSSGDTAKKFGLQRFGKPIMTSRPFLAQATFESAGNDSRLSDMLAVIRERLETNGLVQNAEVSGVSAKKILQSVY